MNRTLDNYPAAAMRHFIDAELLKKRGRNDNAMCHYAFSAECVLKSLYELCTSRSGRVLNHGIADVWDDITQYYAALGMLDAKTEIILSKETIPDKLFERHPERRYEDDIEYTESEVEQAGRFTGKLVHELVLGMLDGYVR